MADRHDVTSKAIIVINDAQTYLDRRVQQASDPMERQGISDWRNWLDKARQEIMTSQPAEGFSPSIAARYQVLLDQLDLNSQHVQQLHEWFDYADVNLVLRHLHNSLTLLIDPGPHGPGGGPRIP